MRDILFRVWDGNRMTNKIRLEFAHGLRLVSVDDLGFDMVGDDKCVLMQSTGLLDKNGVLIYEGDILQPIRKTEYKEPPNGLLCVVEWSEEDCSFRALKDNKNDGEYLLTKSIAQKHWKIIGNIKEKKIND